MVDGAAAGAREPPGPSPGLSRSREGDFPVHGAVHGASPQLLMYGLINQLINC